MTRVQVLRRLRALTTNPVQLRILDELLEAAKRFPEEGYTDDVDAENLVSLDLDCFTLESLLQERRKLGLPCDRGAYDRLTDVVEAASALQQILKTKGAA